MTPPPSSLRILTLCAGFVSAELTAPGAVLPAFPGAEGFGSAASGGSRVDGVKQTVVHVTNLNDEGPGSFNEAISAPGRVVVFDVGGYIHIGKRLKIPDNITLAGETAPGDGICFKDEEVDFTRSSNVIVRHVRFRQGTDYGHKHQYSIGAAGFGIIFDHCSIEWGRWDCIGLTKGKDITFQKCIIGEGLDPQRFGALVYSDNITFKSCLWINNHGRNPKACGMVQYINNVVYNWEVGGIDLGHSKDKKWHDIIGNYFISGPVSKRRGCYYGINEFCQVYQNDNYFDGDCDGILNGKPAPVVGATELTAPWSKTPVPVTPLPARMAYKDVVSDVGTFPTHRDPLDKRLISDLTSLGKQGTLKNFVQDAGGWVPLTSGTALPDSDRNGLPDVWEQAFTGHSTGMNAEALTPSGYTNLEVYLHFMAGPHIFVKTRPNDDLPAPVKIDLRAYTSGYKQPMAYTISSKPAHGQAELVSDGGESATTRYHMLEYLPAPLFSGLDTVTLRATDAEDDVATRTVFVLVSPGVREADTRR